MTKMMLRAVVTLLTTCLLACALVVAAERDTSYRPTRSSPPKSWDAETERIFGEDPLGLLKGPRPTIGPRPGPPGTGTPDDGQRPGGAAGSFAWSRVVSADTVVDEIKAYRTQVAPELRTEGAFKSGGNRKIRNYYSVIAVMFGIAAEYDGPVRWKASAGGARDAFARSAANSKAADSNTFKEAKLRGQDLDELIRGGSVEFDQPEGDHFWSDVSERRPLMIRFKVALEDRLRPWTANDGEFSRNRSQIKHEAEIIAALAEVIQREEFEYFDDDAYLEFCNDMQTHALTLAQAAKENDLETAQKATGEVSKQCSACHEDYKL